MSKKEGRVFLRGLSSMSYGLSGFRAEQLAAPRVRGPEVVVDDGSVGHDGGVVGSTKPSKWRLGPGDDPFLTQTLQVHFVEIDPGMSNKGHGHQNEAAFYILQGKGHEIHDGQRYDWEQDDLVVVHVDSHHQHFNDGDEVFRALVVKAKAMWMYFGLIQQGVAGPLADAEKYGPREDWSQVWTPGVLDRKKVIKPGDTTWETTRDGRVRVLASPDRTDVRLFSVDMYEQEIAAGSRSAKHWHMADEVQYVISGSGYALHWEVGAEIDDKYYARIAKEPARYDFQAGDIVYVPQNTIHQQFAADGQPVRMLCAHNRLFRYLGYDNVTFLEDAPEFAADPAVAARASV